jgi:ubiquinone/menaquinone biosynthesis C-methylase UbiE
LRRGLFRLAPPGRRIRRGALGLLARAAARGLTFVPLGRRLERFLLERTWTARSADMLDRYLVSGYQNPRINVQSILLRHFLIARIGGTGFDDFAEGELRLAVELNEVLRLRAAELGITMGSFLNPTRQAAVRRVDESIADREHAFAERWAEALGRIGASRISVLELACGSANDYRAFVEYGLAPYLDYRGIDLTEKNVMNARRRFPDVGFEVGDVRSLPFGDREFDYVIASDVFEHLSLDGMELALDEAMRVARRGLALTFFNMGEAPDHEVRPTRLYHWNRLSRSRIEERIRARFESVRVVAVAAWLRERYGYAHSYNRHAYSVFAEHPRDTPRAY